ncbi:hypothetical protein B0E52_11080 [Rhodanobacter sp. C06]|uniref:toxin-antitoxin system TumE family protein n=1 Tax=Rhodanobacter sp. C06 TaxID=1945854 RepID=UPI0009873D89|nr:DUF6516 family protein [Rhodanobacter sp. C06]OOG41781.1 hypothetical protein B0E52_11080 [Rhodanobacter sp. C06]
MKAELLLRERHALTTTAFVELVVWRLPQPAPGSAHDFKYRLALVADGACVLRYDNESGKGDHKHVDGRETAYRFRGLAALQDDFWADVEAWEAKA